MKSGAGAEAAMLRPPFSDALVEAEKMSPGGGIPGIDGGWAAAFAKAQRYADQRAAGIEPLQTTAMIIPHQLAHMLSYLGQPRPHEDLRRDLQGFRRDLPRDLRAYAGPRRQEIEAQFESVLSTITDCLAAWAPNNGPVN
jgi:hypothetical protein